MAGCRTGHRLHSTLDLEDDEGTPLLDPSSHAMSEDGYPRNLQPWPRPLALALCLLGIWRPGTSQRARRQQDRHLFGSRPLTELPRVYSHQQSRTVADIQRTASRLRSFRAGTVDPPINNNDEAIPVDWSMSVGNDECRVDSLHCDVCSDNYDVIHVTNAHNKDGTAMNHTLVSIAMVAYLTIVCSLMFYDFVIYTLEFWGKSQNTLFLVSYFTYLFQVLAMPMFSIWVQISVWMNFFRSNSTWAALHNDYIFVRSQYFRGCRSGFKSYLGFVLFVSWPAMCGLLRLIYDYGYRPIGNVHAEISHWVALWSYVLYGSFCYLVYIERKSFQNEFRAIAHFVAAKAPMGVIYIDVCRDRLSAAYQKFRILRNFVGIWMAFTMAVATWGMTAHLTWNYVIFSFCQFGDDVSAGLPLLNVLIWSQKIMFFVLPMLAVGGINIDYIWMEFRYIVTNHQRHSYSTFWNHIACHMSDINLFGKGLTATLLFSVLGLYLGLELSSNSQNVAFWNGPGEFNLSSMCKH